MKVFFLILLLFINISIYSQDDRTLRLPIDTSVLGKWPTISNGKVCNNGSYVSYMINEFIPNPHLTTIVQAIDGKWKTELVGVSEIKFTEDSRSVVCLKDDSLQILTLKESKRTIIPNVLSFKLISGLNTELLVYRSKNPGKYLVLRDMKTGKEETFPKVENYFFNGDGESVVLQEKSSDSDVYMLKWCSLRKRTKIPIWSGHANVMQLNFDKSGKQLVFTTENAGTGTLWYYKIGMSSASPILIDGSKKIRDGLAIGKIEGFSKDGNRLLFYLERKIDINTLQPKPLTNVNVWSYRDLMLQSERLQKIKERVIVSKNYLTVMHVGDGHVLQIQQDFEDVANSKTDEYCIVRQLDTKQYLIGDDAKWDKAYGDSKLYLVSLQNGKRLLLPWKHKLNILSKFSPEGKFIVYCDELSLSYISYQISSGIVHNITDGIKTDLSVNTFHIDEPKEKRSLIGIGGWLSHDKGIFIYDRNDIWLVDPLGIKQSVNVTNGYGLRNQLILRLDKDNNKLDYGQDLILVAFNYANKQNGYFKIKLGKNEAPEKLTLDDCLYSQIPFFSEIPSSGLVKAKNTNAWIVLKQTARESPNYYWTSDLKKYIKVSDLHPEKKWQWLTSELHTWVAPDGDTLQGILYKPENFEPNKKYPILFSYYEQFSDELNKFRQPSWSTDRINIPWFISQGYLVFQPDIHYRIPHIKASVLNCIISSAKYISQLPFVDAKNMGIQGHSFGGYETGLIITGTDVFSAACAASGYYNLVSDAGSLLSWGVPRTGVSERYMSGNLWDKKNEYIENSPIFYIDKVKTPLLIMTGELDPQVPHDQSIELYLGLRRLGKATWMLSYKNGQHTLTSDFNNAVDYTIRLTQFFDHYLKGTPTPQWMWGDIISDSSIKDNRVLPGGQAHL